MLFCWGSQFFGAGARVRVLCDVARYFFGLRAARSVSQHEKDLEVDTVLCFRTGFFVEDDFCADFPGQVVAPRGKKSTEGFNGKPCRSSFRHFFSFSSSSSFFGLNKSRHVRHMSISEALPFAYVEYSQPLRSPCLPGCVGHRLGENRQKARAETFPPSPLVSCPLDVQS